MTLVARSGPLAQVPSRAKRSRRLNRRQRKAGVWYAMAIASVFVLAAAMKRWMYDSETEALEGSLDLGRRLSASASCSASDRDGSAVTVVLYMLIILYCFVGLAIVCDDWFVDSLEHLSEEMKLSDDVAGATFMAAGSSAPELFTSIGDVFGPSNNIGIGTIVGSAMFNILVIVALAAAVTPHELPIDWRPIARDVTFYSIAIGQMVLFFWPKSGEVSADNKKEGRIYFPEAMIMVLTYFSYILFMAYNARIFAKCAPAKTAPDVKYDAAESGQAGGDQVEKIEGPSAGADGEATKEQEKKAEAGGDGGGGDDDDDEGFELWKKPVPMASKEGVMWALMWPFYFTFKVTIPKFNLKVCFVLSILWIGLLCWIMVDLATAVGCILNVPAQVMGIVVLAVGTSVPDAMGSMIEAKEGKADMAIANAVGSNVFDILLGLGLPWMAKCLMEGNDHFVTVNADGIVTEVIILYGTVFLFAGVIALNKFRMNQRLGKIFLAAYGLYILFIILTKGFELF